MISNRGIGVVTDKPLPPRRESDFYPTDRGTVDRVLLAAAGYFPNTGPETILDPGAGAGVWGEAAKALWGNALLVGIELREVPKPTPYNAWLSPLDFLQRSSAQISYELVMGNPPYGEAEAFVRKGLQFLAPGGVLVYLLRLAFLEGQGRRDGLFAEHPPAEVLICSKRPSFTGDGKTNATAFAGFLWKEGWVGSTSVRWLK